MKISCVMGTCRGRKRFLAQAIEYWRRQTYPDKELVIVDDDPEDFTPPADVKYIKIPKVTSIGLKLNAGIAAASGELIQKFDDDDWYHPTFMAHMAANVVRHGQHSIGSVNTFLALLVRPWKLKFSGYGWFLGNGFCFSKKLWEKAPFRDLTVGEDRQFLKDHPDVTRPTLTDPELCIVVRHGQGHLWKEFCGASIDDLLEKHRLDYGKPLAAVMPEQDVKFYESLRKEKSCP